MTNFNKILTFILIVLVLFCFYFIVSFLSGSWCHCNPEAILL